MSEANPEHVEPPENEDDNTVVTEARIDEFSEAVEHDARDYLVSEMADMHPADIADVMEQMPRHLALDMVELLGQSLSYEALTELDVDLRTEALERLPDNVLAEAIEELDSDDAAILVDDLEEDRQQRILRQVNPSDRSAIETSLQFDEETAGRLMQRDFVAAPEFWTVGQAIDHMRAQVGNLPEPFFEVYLIDPAFHLMGVVVLSELICASRDTPLIELKEDLTAIVKPDMDQEEVAYIFQQYNLTSAPVVDEDNRLTGMITIDDMVDVIQNENKEDLLALSQVNDGSASQSVWDAFKSRAPWLGVNLFTAFLASGVISLFETALDQIVALAMLMPVVAALGGNAGSQALAVTVRAIAERDMMGAMVARAVRRELFTAVLNGALFSAGVSIIAFIWFRDPRLAGVIGAAMFLTFIWAGLSGVLVPLTLRRLGADPAVASSVFVLTTVDIVGFCAFLGFASMVLL
ncbi:MAG: magnesium transporter [Hirschia sp.]|nr:magnesium transporter [Hirschia sp.]MBF17208.1 magnesium transporter [Hirschia sp.]